METLKQKSDHYFDEVELNVELANEMTLPFTETDIACDDGGPR